ncbi:MAG: DUF6580 family putative transport protein [Bacteroidia bacterium]
MNTPKPNLLLILGAVLVASVFRLIPHYPNFTPIAAIALMGGAFIGNRWISILVPLLAMLVSDYLTLVFVNAGWTTPYEYFTSVGTLFIYASIIATTILGRWNGRPQNENFISKSYSGKLAFNALAAAVIFFVMSNIGVWLNGDIFATNAEGLSATFIAALPYFGYNLTGNLVYAFLFFGILEVLLPKKISAKIIVKR